MNHLKALWIIIVGENLRGITLSLFFVGLSFFCFAYFCLGFAFSLFECFVLFSPFTRFFTCDLFITHASGIQLKFHIIFVIFIFYGKLKETKNILPVNFFAFRSIGRIGVSFRRFEFLLVVRFSIASSCMRDT